MINLLISIVSLLALAALVWLLLNSTRSLEALHQELKSLQDASQREQDKAEKLIRDEIARSKDEVLQGSRDSRLEQSASLKQLSDTLSSHIRDLSLLQHKQLDGFALQLTTLGQGSREDLTKMRDTIELKLKSLQEDNNRKLEQMRETVDEKLHSTLEKRLGESFQLVSERLEQVHKGLGEMQSLASGVGDLKKVLSGVKTRGIWGEVHLGMLLEDILSPDQYTKNFAVKTNSQERVDFAVRLPGQDTEPVWLPLDSKFPLEDYHRLIEAQERGELELVEAASKQLERAVREEAKSIRDKYISPPTTTDFAILFLPTEGLYAEILRRPGLGETLQREFRVVIAGPTTLGAFLNSLQIGFRTLTIQKRSSEVWALLAAIKKEFSVFGDILDKTQEKLQQASKTIDQAATKSRTIERKLSKVQELPVIDVTEPVKVLGVELN